MSSLVPSINKRARTEDFQSMKISDQNVNRHKLHASESSSYITDESKKAISVLINKHERTKSELKDKNTEEEKIKEELEGLRTEVLELQTTIKEDKDALRELNAKVEMGIQEISAVPDTQETILERLIAKEGEIDRELFHLRDDKVIARGELWFALMGKVDESIEYPDQASRDRNLLMRKEMYIRTKRTLAKENVAQLLLAKEDIQRQKLEIARPIHVEGYLELREASPIPEDSDQESIVPDSHLGEDDSYVDDSHVDDNPVQDDQQHLDFSWVTDNREESPNVRGPILGDQIHMSEETRLAIIEENKFLKLELERKIRNWKEKFDHFRLATTDTINRLSSEVSSSQETLAEYENALHESGDVRRRLVHDLAKVEEEKTRLLVLAQEISLPVLASNAEYMKQFKRDGIHMSSKNSHLPFNEALARAGDNATTGGHVNAHFASIVLSEKEVISGPVISHEMFLNIYGVSVGEYRNLYQTSDKLDEMLNMHATLVECGSFTGKTLSQTRDFLFLNQFTQCLLEFEGIDAPTPAEKGRIFDAAVRENQIEAFNEMVEITQDIEHLHKAAI